jgi:hypothetical protein
MLCSRSYRGFAIRCQESCRIQQRKYALTLNLPKLLEFNRRLLTELRNWPLRSVNRSGKSGNAAVCYQSGSKEANLTSERKMPLLKSTEKKSRQPTFPLRPRRRRDSPSPPGPGEPRRREREGGRSGGRPHGLGMELRPPCPRSLLGTLLVPAGGRRGRQHHSKKLCRRWLACLRDVAARAVKQQRREHEKRPN